jgi:hypothetical protein
VVASGKLAVGGRRLRSLVGVVDELGEAVDAEVAAEEFLPLAEVFEALELDNGGQVVPGHFEVVLGALRIFLVVRNGGRVEEGTDSMMGCLAALGRWRVDGCCQDWSPSVGWSAARQCEEREVEGAAKKNLCCRKFVFMVYMGVGTCSRHCLVLACGPSGIQRKITGRKALYPKFPCLKEKIVTSCCL